MSRSNFLSPSLSIRLHVSLLALFSFLLGCPLRAQQLGILQEVQGSFQSPLTLGSDGYLYGTNPDGAYNYYSGVIFKMSPTGNFTVLRDWDVAPCTGLTQGADGYYYGLSDGGTSGNGFIYKINSDGVFLVLHNFNGSDGTTSSYGLRNELTLGTDGNLYGTTSNGGTHNQGCLFRISPSGQYAVLHSFYFVTTVANNPAAAHEGTAPLGRLAHDAMGNLYGTASQGGDNNYGAIFEVTPQGAYSTVYAFYNYQYVGQYPNQTTIYDGISPASGLTADNNGNFYGCAQGADYHSGVFFKVSAAGGYTKLFLFGDNPNNPPPPTPAGVAPAGAPLLASDGTFYIVTAFGGDHGGTAGYGTIYHITAAGAATKLYSFQGYTQLDAASPASGLVQDSHGVLYGTDASEYSYSDGNIYKFDPNSPLTDTLLDTSGVWPYVVLPAPPWAEGSEPFDTPDTTGAGPSRADGVNLATGVYENNPEPDIVVRNPTGPNVVYTRRYRSALGVLGYASPGLSPGWTDNFDLTIQAPPAPQGWYPVTLRYPNGAEELLTPATDANNNLMLDKDGHYRLIPPPGAPYFVTGVPSGTVGIWSSLAITCKDESVCTLTPGANGLYALTQTRSLLNHGLNLARDASNRINSISNDTGQLLLQFDYQGNYLSTLTDVASSNAMEQRQVTFQFGAGPSTGSTVLTGVLQISLPSPTPLPAPKWSYVYSALDRQPVLTTVSTPDPSGSGNLVSNTITYGPTYLLDGTLNMLQDANGNQRAYSLSVDGLPENAISVINANNGGYLDGASQKTTVPAGNTPYSYYLRLNGGDVYSYQTSNSAYATSTIAYGDANNPLMPTQSLTYKGSGQPTNITYDAASSYDPNFDAMTMAPVHSGNAKKVEVNSNGQMLDANYTYDYSVFLLGRLQSVYESTSSGLSKAPTTFTYIPSGSLHAGLVQSVATPVPGTSNSMSSVTTSYAYTPAGIGNVYQITMPAPNNGAGTVAYTYTYGNDGAYNKSEAMGEPTTITDPLGAPHTTHFRYDGRGNVTAVIDAIGNETDYQYNLADQVIKITYPPSIAGSMMRAYTQFNYLYPGGPLNPGASPYSIVSFDEIGNPVRQLNQASGLEGELASVSGSVLRTQLIYDAKYRVKQVKDGNNHPTNYVFSGNDGNLSQTQYPGYNYGSSFDALTGTQYDANRNLTQFTDGRGNLTKYQLASDDDRLQQVQYPAGTLPNITYTYDDFGRVKQVMDQNTTVAYSYDDLDNITQTTTIYSPNGLTTLPPQTISYTYNTDGSLRTMGIPTGSFIYTYDNARRCIQLNDPYSHTFTWTYYNNDWLQTQKSGNIVTATYTYNGRGFLTELKNTSATANVFSDFAGQALNTGMGYDSVGNLSAVQSTLTGYPRLSGLTTYGYDGLDQLQTEYSSRNGFNGGPVQGYQNTYNYDSAGNSSAVAPSYNWDNQLGSSGFVYDGDGNPTSYSGTTFTYDVDDELTQIGSMLTMGYRPDNGLRAWKQNSSGTRTYYLYDGATPVCELNSDGSTAFVNVFGPNGLLARVQTNEFAFNNSATRQTTNSRVINAHPTTYYSFDPSGNVVERFNDNASILNAEMYSAYGMPASQGSTTPDCFGFGGQAGYYQDAETGLILCGYRYYDAAAERWINRDPTGYEGGINLYAYCGNNPVNRIDPMGLDWGVIGPADHPWFVFTMQGTQRGLATGGAVIKDTFSFGYISSKDYVNEPGYGFSAGAAWVSREAVITMFTMGAGKAVELVRGSRAIPLGITILGKGDRLLSYIAKVKPIQGYFDVAIHGTGKGFAILQDGKYIEISHRALASLITKAGYRGGAIRLISCNAGAEKAAQYLANKLGVEVLAPDSIAWIHPNGLITIGKTAIRNTGRWVKFLPGVH